jgi:RNA polymerase sigma factor (sigma-70 family)
MQDQEFNQFLADMRPRLHRSCARMTGSAIDGDDVVQDVFVKAIVARPADGTIDNPQGWLFRIAHNAAPDHLRYRARHPEVPLERDTDMSETTHLSAPDDDIVAVGFYVFAVAGSTALRRCAQGCVGPFGRGNRRHCRMQRSGGEVRASARTGKPEEARRRAAGRAGRCSATRTGRGSRSLLPSSGPATSTVSAALWLTM